MAGSEPPNSALAWNTFDTFGDDESYPVYQSPAALKKHARRKRVSEKQSFVNLVSKVVKLTPVAKSGPQALPEVPTAVTASAQAVLGKRKEKKREDTAPAKKKNKIGSFAPEEASPGLVSNSLQQDRKASLGAKHSSHPKPAKGSALEGAGKGLQGPKLTGQLLLEARTKKRKAGGAPAEAERAPLRAPAQEATAALGPGMPPGPKTKPAPVSREALPGSNGSAPSGGGAKPGAAKHKMALKQASPEGLPEGDGSPTAGGVTGAEKKKRKKRRKGDGGADADPGPGPVGGAGVQIPGGVQTPGVNQTPGEDPEGLDLERKGAAAAPAAAGGVLGDPEAAPAGGRKKKKKRGDPEGQTRNLGGSEPGVVGTRGPPTASGRPESGAGLAGGKGKGKQGLLDKMRSRLQGGHFRWLNEQLYTSEGHDAFQLMQKDTSMYDQYHQGFREQILGWPVKPVDVAIRWLAGKPKTLVVADFGCGDAQLAASVPQRVHSFDLVAGVPGVIACNMASVPLGPGSVDVAVFCLALMGLDYGSFLKEAHRVLKTGGRLWIAEVRSRFADSAGSDKEGIDALVAALTSLGFKQTSRDSSNKMFVILELKKISGNSVAGVSWPELKPCIYKRR